MVPLGWCFFNRLSSWIRSHWYFVSPLSSSPSMHCSTSWQGDIFVSGAAKSMHIVIRIFLKSWWSIMSFQSDMYDPETTDKLQCLILNSKQSLLIPPGVSSVLKACTSHVLLSSVCGAISSSVLRSRWWRLLRKLQLCQPVGAPIIKWLGARD